MRCCLGPLGCFPVSEEIDYYNPSPVLRQVIRHQGSAQCCVPCLIMQTAPFGAHQPSFRTFPPAPWLPSRRIIAKSSPRQLQVCPSFIAPKAAGNSALLFQHAVPLPDGLLRGSHSLELTFLGARRYYRGLHRDPLVVEGLKGWCTASSTTLFLRHHHHFTFSPFRIGAYTFPGHH